MSNMIDDIRDLLELSTLVPGAVLFAPNEHYIFADYECKNSDFEPEPVRFTGPYLVAAVIPSETTSYLGHRYPIRACLLITNMGVGWIRWARVLDQVLEVDLLVGDEDD